MSGFSENFFAGLQAGQQRKKTEQDFADAQEERGIQKMLLDLQMRKHKIDEAIQKRELAKGNVDLMQGQPFANLSRPVNEGESGGYDLANVTPEQGIPQQRVIDPVNIPGVEELGVPGVSVKPRSMEEIVGAQTQAKFRDLMLTPQKVGPGEKVMVGGQTLAEGGPKEETRSVEVQAADALAKGDKPAYARLMKVKDDMRAAVDPTIAAIRDATLANLKAQQANGALTPAQFRVAEAMADDYTKASTNYLTQVQGYQAVQAAAKDPSAAGDLAMVFAFMKTLDPASTVREGEFANAQNATGVPDRVRNVYNRAMSGERLNPTQRADFLKQAGSQYSQAQKRQQGLIQVYSARAKANNLPPDQVVIDYDKVFGVEAGVEITVTAPDGSVHPFETQSQADEFKRLAGIP